LPTSTLGGITTQARTFYIGTLLKRLLPYLPLLADGQKATIPRNTGIIAQWRKYSALSLATTALTEGVTPAGNSLAQTAITATIAQYGDYLTESDILITAGIDNNIVAGTEVLGEQAGQTIHRVVVTELGAGSSVRYANGRASRITVAAGDNLTVLDIRKVVRDLERNNAIKYQDGFYHGAISPSQAFDLTSDTAYVDLAGRYVNVDNLQANELVPVYGARLRKTTDVPIFTAGGAAGIDVHAAVIYGPNAFGVTDLAGMGLAAMNPETNQGAVNVIVIPLDEPDKSDPLHQRAYLGWKVGFVVKTLDSARIERLETAVTP
jgi:N4-gp56 family major capsid protein